MTTEVFGVPVEYKIVGEGTPVLCIHGWTESMVQMEHSIEPVFAPFISYKRIYFDLPGMGKTPRCDQVKNSDDMLQFVKAFVEQVIPDGRFLAISRSYGGYILRGLLAAMPERIMGGIFICPLVEPVRQKRILPNFKVVYRNEELIKQLPASHRVLFTHLFVIQDQYTYDRFLDELASAAAIDEPYLRSISHSPGYAFSELPEENGLCDVPTLFFLGKQDNVVGYTQCVDLVRDHYTRHSLLLWENAGHNLEIEHHNLFCETVKSWLRGIENEESI